MFVYISIIQKYPLKNIANRHPIICLKQIHNNKGRISLRYTPFKCFVNDFYPLVVIFSHALGKASWKALKCSDFILVSFDFS